MKVQLCGAEARRRSRPGRGGSLVLAGLVGVLSWAACSSPVADDSNKARPVEGGQPPAPATAATTPPPGSGPAPAPAPAASAPAPAVNPGAASSPAGSGATAGDPAAPAAGSYSVTFDSVPPGAVITINGTESGTTPKTVQVSGTVEAVLTHPDFDDVGRFQLTDRVAGETLKHPFRKAKAGGTSAATPGTPVEKPTGSSTPPSSGPVKKTAPKVEPAATPKVEPKPKPKPPSSGPSR